MTQEEFERLAKAGNQGDSKAVEALVKEAQQGELRAWYWLIGFGLKIGKLNASIYEQTPRQINTIREILKKKEAEKIILIEKDCDEEDESPSRFKEETEMYIPQGTTRIGNGAFQKCKKMTTVIIPNSVTSIGNYAFSDCSSLNSLIIPNSVTSIGKSAFNGCESLTSVNIPIGVKNICSGAFFRCISLTSLIIPNSVTSIEKHAFWGCSMASVTIPDSVNNIEFGAFDLCKNLSKIIVPRGTKSRFEKMVGLKALASKIVEE